MEISLHLKTYPFDIPKLLYVYHKQAMHPTAFTMKSRLHTSVFVLSFVLLIQLLESEAFLTSSTLTPTSSNHPSLSCRHSFFKDLIDKAFQNDDSLLSASDKVTGQLDDKDDDENDNNTMFRKPTLTETQAKWQALQSQTPQLEGTTINVNLFLSGIPERDPSNDLYGSRTNISSRDRVVGLALPETPTLTDISICFQKDNICKCLTETPFTKITDDNNQGDWIVSEDKTQVRFRIPVTGYSRRVETTGTIQNVFWSKSDEKTTQTTTAYTIPAGWLYGEAKITKNARGQLLFSEGVLKVEQTTGMFGIASKMVPCGRFDANVVTE